MTTELRRRRRGGLRAAAGQLWGLVVEILVVCSLVGMALALAGLILLVA